MTKLLLAVLVFGTLAFATSNPTAKAPAEAAGPSLVYKNEDLDMSYFNGSQDISVKVSEKCVVRVYLLNFFSSGDGSKKNAMSSVVGINILNNENPENGYYTTPFTQGLNIKRQGNDVVLKGKTEKCDWEDFKFSASYICQSAEALTDGKLTNIPVTPGSKSCKN